MIRVRRGVVIALGAARPGAHELEVDVDGERATAIAYPELCGPVTVGDMVILNTTAVALGLGTGGVHFVVAVEGADVGDDGFPGRIMKARYTPVQTAVASVEERHRDALEGSPGLEHTPVVCAPLHSMIGPIAAGAKRAGEARVVYVMTDGAALPGAFSRLVFELRDSGLIDGWITTGQSFGGELEAVTVWTGMLAAKEVLGADVVVVADGPGNLGTDTTWGVSALGSGNALNAAAALGGRPIPSLRISFADGRERHRGVSHHSLTILRDVCLVPTDVPVPALEDDAQRALIWDALRAAKLEERHQLVEVDGRPALDELSRPTYRAPFDGARRRRGPGVLPGRGGGGRPRGQGRGREPALACRRRRLVLLPVVPVREPPSDPLSHTHEVQVADARPDEDEADVDDRQQHPEHAAHRSPGAPAGAGRRSAEPSGERQHPEHGVDPDRQPDDETQRHVVVLDGVPSIGSWWERLGRHHMCEISCSTRSSTLRNGSLHSTVRCA